MIRKTKRNFIVLSMTALLVLLMVIVAGMNVINYNAVISEADLTLALLSEHRGRFPDFGPMDKLPFHSPETPYETRFFSVLLDEKGRAIQTDTSRIKAIDAGQASSYAEEIFSAQKTRGFAGEYRYLSTQEGPGQRMIFLDCSRELHNCRTFLWASIGMAVVGYGIFFAVIVICSERIVRPVTESYEKQRRFITDAGHELKTPLTIIRADADVLEMELGENEWIEDIRRQTSRLTALTGDLVYLSRMEESGQALQTVDFSFSDAVEETVLSFHALAQTRKITLERSVAPLLSINGEEKAIRQLVNILLDNAMKYTPQGGRVLVTARRQGKHLVLTVGNTTAAPIPRDQLERMFDRFYRLDASRSSQTGGSGIGLSVAKAIVQAHGGKITAAAKDGPALEIGVTLPVCQIETKM